MPITEMIHFRKCWQTYKVFFFSYYFVQQVWLFPVLILVSNASRRVTLSRLYLVKVSAYVLESYGNCTVQNSCAQRSCISLTQMRTIYFTVYYASVWTSGRRPVDCNMACHFPLPHPRNWLLW